MSDRLKLVIEDHVSEGASVANLGSIAPPRGYQIMLNPDESHYYWVCADGRESVIHWDRWAVYKGAKNDFNQTRK